MAGSMASVSPTVSCCNFFVLLMALGMAPLLAQELAAQIGDGTGAVPGAGGAVGESCYIASCAVRDGVAVAAAINPQDFGP